MSLNEITLARPYAKAIFEHAVATKSISDWSEILHDLTVAILDEAGLSFIQTPGVTQKQAIELLMSLFTQSKISSRMSAFNDELIRLVTMLAENKRLPILPHISLLFDALRAEQEKTCAVVARSAFLLSEDQKQNLTQALSQKLQRGVTLKITVDPDLLGGLIVQVNDLIIDCSVRGQLNKLGVLLAS